MKEGGYLDIKVLTDIATSQAVWAIVCIYMIIYVMKQSEKRESKLMNHLERSNESQEKTAIALDGINQSLAKLESRVDKIEKINNRGDSI